MRAPLQLYNQNDDFGSLRIDSPKAVMNRELIQATRSYGIAVNLELINTLIQFDLVWKMSCRRRDSAPTWDRDQKDI